MKPIILDTNILLDIFVFEDARANELRNALLKQQIKAYSSKATVEELVDVISRPLFSLEDKKQVGIVQQWQVLSQSMDDLSLEAAPWKCHDPDDQIFLDIAFTLRPSILISKDKEVLRLANQAAKEDILITADYGAFTR